jgi:hypothetical protein
LLVPRSRPESLAALLDPLKQLSEALAARDKAFMYQAIVVEEVLCTPSRALDASPRELDALISLEEALDSGR